MSGLIDSVTVTIVRGRECDHAEGGCPSRATERRQLGLRVVRLARHRGVGVTQLADACVQTSVIPRAACSTPERNTP